MLPSSDQSEKERMASYQFPYLSPHQSRTHEPTAYQLELASAIENVFSNGKHELSELIAGLNASRVRPPFGGNWTEENFTRLMREFGEQS
jgi:hypothetical protein